MRGYDLFGDPCPGKAKNLVVEAICGTQQPRNANEGDQIWSSDRSLNLKNFETNIKVISAMYNIAKSSQNLPSLQDDLRSLTSLMNSGMNDDFYIPLISFENNIKSIPLFGYTSAWFGIIAQTSLNNGKTYCISFRGSQSDKDWSYDYEYTSSKLPQEMIDLDLMSQSDYDNVLVHDGFLKLYLGLRYTILDAISSINPSDWIVSGHSLGAALATLAMFDLMTLGQKIHSAYIIASPRIGNPFWVKAFNSALERQKYGNGISPLFRIANSADPITQVPPAVLGKPGTVAQYLHVGDCSHTFEKIPANVSIAAMSGSDFIEWVHSCDTYLDLVSNS
jgi:hypothetical protein